MSLLEWFGGDSKEVLKQMVKHNCAVLFYIGIYDFIYFIIMLTLTECHCFFFILISIN